MVDIDSGLIHDMKGLFPHLVLFSTKQETRQMDILIQIKIVILMFLSSYVSNTCAQSFAV